MRRRVVSRYLLCAALLAAMAAGLCAADQDSGAPRRPQQGIRGKVVKLVGDFTMDPPTGERRPLCVPVHVFRGRIQPFEEPDPRHPALVKILQPDKEGRFEIELPAGEYTVVAEIGGKLYLNNWMEDGSWAITVVREGTWTQCTIEDVLEATF